MSEKDRYLSILEELQLGNEILLKENLELKKTISELSNENTEYKRVAEAYQIAMRRWESSNAD